MTLVSLAYRPKPAYRAPRPLEGAQLATWANSAAPSAATLSNTAAGYTTLGGLFRFTPVAGAATDYALFGYQNVSTHRLIISGVAISLAVGTAIGATADVNQWGLGINSTAVSLATTDSGSTYGPRRIALGTQGFPASAAAGTAAPDIVRLFDAPLIVEPSRYVHVILRRTNGTTTGELIGSVTFDAWFEPADDIASGG
jgi:hypothetical protein